MWIWKKYFKGLQNELNAQKAVIDSGSRIIKTQEAIILQQKCLIKCLIIKINQFTKENSDTIKKTN